LWSIEQNSGLCSLKPLPNAANSRDVIPIRPATNQILCPQNTKVYALPIGREY
jgi:hypothetical protein